MASGSIGPDKVSPGALKGWVVAFLVTANVLVLGLSVEFLLESGSRALSGGIALVAVGFVSLSALCGWAVLHLQARMARESSRNQLYLHHASDGIHILDREGNLLEASDQFCKLLGYRRDELLGRNVDLWEAGWPADALRNQVLPGWLDLDEATCFETCHRRRDGTLIDVEVNIVPFGMDGQTCLFGAAREIGEKKRQYQALLRSQALLRQSEERYRLLLQNSPVGILHYDPDLVVTYANDRFEEIMQVPKGHMVGLDSKKLRDQLVVPPMRHALAGIVSRYEGPYVTSYGQVHLWISMRCAPVMTPEGKILGGIVILEDITGRKRIEENERRQRESLARLNEIAAYSHLPLVEQLQEALAIGTRHLGLEFGIVSRIRGEDYEIFAHVSPPDTLYRGQVLPFARTYCQITLEQGGVVSIADMGHSDYRSHPCYRDFRLEAYIGIPIQVEGEVFGTVNFSSPRPYHRSFDDGDKEFISLLARWVGSAIERHQAESRLRLAASVFSHAHEGIMICDADQVILEVNPTFSEITGYGRQEIIGRTPRFLSSGRQDGEFYRAMWQAIREQGHWEGEVWNRRKDGSSYAERLTISSVVDDNGQVTHYIGTFSDISLLKRHQDELERLAHYDPLTHLPNRALLSDRMAQALAQCRRGGALVAVCYLDLDGFKAVNDELGHDAGDLLLAEVAQRLRETVRAGDTVARLGGDEFVLLLVGVDGREECERAAVRVLRAIAAPVAIQGQERSVSGSIGIALFPDDGDDADTLLRQADQAMYQAKQAGKNRHLFSDASSNHRARDRREALERMGRALERGELQLHYQPIIDMGRGRVLGFEGLLRWRHPERGLLPPADFLPALLGTDLETDLGRWVLAQGMGQLAEWRRRGIGQSLSLNISTGHLLSPGFADELAALLLRHPQVEPRGFAIEILETAAMEDLDGVIAVLRRCREMGVTVTLDDFGSGHSSLASFRRLPVDTLKIDQGFVRSMLQSSDDLTIVESVIRLTRAFDRNLVAEGVETVEIGMLLLHLGCSVGQGYGIARPMPAEEVPAWLAAFVPDRNWSVPIASMTRDALPLFIAELEHRAWVRQMGAWLDADPAAPSPPPLDGRLCRFGRWYAGSGKRRFGRSPAFRDIGETHEAVHRLGRELARLAVEGRREEAGARFGEMLALRDRLVEQLAALQAEWVLKKAEEPSLTGTPV